MRLGDSITITQAEAELLGSDAFHEFASADLTSKVLLTRGETGYYSLALPNIGKQITAALYAFAASDVQVEQARTAQSLAVAIAQRISPGSASA